MALFTWSPLCGWKLLWGLWSHKGSFSANQSLTGCLDDNPAPSDSPPLFLSLVHVSCTYALPPSLSLTYTCFMLGHSRNFPLSSRRTLQTAVLSIAVYAWITKTVCRLLFVQPAFPGFLHMHRCGLAGSCSYRKHMLYFTQLMYMSNLSSLITVSYRKASTELCTDMSMCCLPGQWSKRMQSQVLRPRAERTAY